MKFSQIFITSLLTMASLVASAVPAKRGLFAVTQPDGSQLMIQRVGDERMHFTLTEDRKILVFSDGAYYYGRVADNGCVVSTDVLAAPVANRTEEALEVMQSFDDIDCTTLLEQRTASVKAPSRAADQSGMGRFTGNFPRTGKIRGLAILVQYSDVKFTHPTPRQYFGDMLMKDGFNEYSGTGSAHDYFYSNSKGQFDPQFDLYGPVTLSGTRKYYGNNDSWGNDEHAADMIAEACRLLDSQINFADYDMDNDGYVDNVFVFYAGQGEASYGPAESIWPHQWELLSGGINLSLDGKRINKYACTNEWESTRPDGVGTFIHEFSHVMGLPDLYCTDDSKTSATPGAWSVLDYGPYNNDGRTPPNYSIFERNAMGWIDPIVLNEGASIDLENLADSNTGCLIPTNKSTEFFLLENRQRTGWDAYIPGHGLLIWHVDFVQRVWDNNAVNSNPNHNYVRIVPANNNANVNSGWSWPGTSRKTSFTSTTTPALKTWSGLAVNMPITDIKETNGHILFLAAGGGTKIDTPVASPATNISSGGFTASWQPVDGATDYLLTVTTLAAGVAATQTYDGKELPEGWSKNFTDTYTASTSVGVATPSLKFSSTGARLETSVYPDDITAISFWHKGMGTGTTVGSYIEIEGYQDGNWISIDKVTPVTNAGTAYKLEDIPAGVRQLRFTYNKDKGNMAVDDIVITYKDLCQMPIANYDNISTGGQTSYYVDTTSSNATKFEYSVKATDGKGISSTSNVVAVELSDASGVDDVLTDSDSAAPVEYYNLQGIRIENPANGIFIRRQGSTVTKVLIK